MRDSSNYGFNDMPDFVGWIVAVLVLTSIIYCSRQIEFPSNEEVQTKVIRENIKSECLK